MMSHSFGTITLGSTLAGEHCPGIPTSNILKEEELALQVKTQIYSININYPRADLNFAKLRRGGVSTASFFACSL